MDFASPTALLERLLTAKREVVFLVGAPLTAPTGSSGLGVPGVAAMVDRIRAMFQGRPRIARELEEKLKSALNQYQAAFRHVVDCRGQDDVNGIIRDAVLEARLPGARPTPQSLASGASLDPLENDLDGWHYPPAVEALGRILARYSTRFGRTVLTTNFDPLIELSVRRARGRAFSSMLHGDGSLEQSRGEGCHVVHLHGYWHGTDTLHSPLQLGQDRPQLRASLARLLRNRTVVVLAYGGWDDIFTRTLQEVTADQGSYPDVLWCFYDSDAARIQRSGGHIFDQLRPAIARQRAIFYAGIDAHGFLPELCAELESEATAAGSPAASLTSTELSDGGPALDDARFAGRTAQREEILQAFERGQPVQLLGPRGMGKSSLLRWVHRHARALGRPAAFVNARGLAGRSASDLVLAAAEALGKRPEVRDMLFAESAVPDPRAAEKALALLGHACLLVDEADALAEGDHGFDRGFFDVLRALGQGGKLQWISASEHDLSGLFQKTGLNSEFLNDARRIRVGALSRADVEAIAHASGIAAQHTAFAVDLAGGSPPALGWLARRLAGGKTGLAGVEGDLRRWIRPLFALWWERLDTGKRALLKRAAGEGLAVAGLPDEERRMAQGLADDGFLVEQDGRFEITGRAWRDFVSEAGGE